MYDNLFEPLQVRSLTIPNRIARSAHGAGLRWVDDSDDLVDFHEARARGGVGLSVLAWGGVHPSSSVAWPFYDESILPGSSRIAEAVHRHGSKMFVQLVHRGSQLPNPGGAPLSASDVPNPQLGVVPVPMTAAQISDVVAGFAAAARNAQASGMDGVEVQAGHGYLVGQFLSPATNLRTDEYGGSVENRMRFLREIIAAIRSETDDFPIGIRISADELVEGGLTSVETAEIARLVEPSVDLISVSLSSYYRYHMLVAPMDEPLGYQISSSEIVTRAVSVPTMVTGRIMTLDHASEIVSQGQADLVSMVRAMLADPELVNKARAGRENEIRPCIGSSQGCMGHTQVTGRLGCIVNVAAGQESTIPFEAPVALTKRKILVVGGGPAGLEVARTAAVRGHQVELHELTNKLGGQVAIAAAAPHRSDFGAITQWLGEELDRLGVKVHLRSPVDVDVVLAADADAVVIATGSLPRRDGFQAGRPRTPIPGSHRRHVYVSWDVFGFGGRASIGKDAVVFDDTGRFDALSVADALLEAGASVTFVTPHAEMGARVEFPVATVAATRERLMGGNFTFLPGSELAEIGPDSVRIIPVGTQRVIEVPADTVVIVGYNTSERGLADALASHDLEVHVIGDAAGGSTLRQAIQDAATIGRSL